MDPAEEAAQRRRQTWRERHRRPFDMERHGATLRAILEEIRALPAPSPEELARLLRRHALPEGGALSKVQLLQGYRQLCQQDGIAPDRELLRRLRLKPTRTLSGVAPVAVLTAPAPCPGACLFCPREEGMPVSYLSGEPGAQRAADNAFDPYAQTAGRVAALRAAGHRVDKVELLILGGTWSAYPEDYQEWFVGRCLEALNAAPDFRSSGRQVGFPAVSGRLSPQRGIGEDQPGRQEDKVISAPSAVRPSLPSDYCASLDRAALPGGGAQDLGEAQRRNETAPCRCVGLVVETRPDWVTPAEVARLRRLGVTKVQLGLQSLDDDLLARNRRGHDVAASREAMRLLRLAGFKVVAHWMPNLLGATPEGDRADFRRLWDDPALRPDELKIYPTALLPGTALYEHWQRGAYAPYDEETLVPLLADCKALIPPYCRLDRLMRDIPAGCIAAGVRKSNLRQVVRQRMRQEGRACRCIRCREVRGRPVDLAALRLERIDYAAGATHEVFLQYVTPEGRLAGFLRLSLPREAPPIEELAGCAVVREVHVYGPALELEAVEEGAAQHGGLGTRLLEAAGRLAGEAGYRHLAVIAAVGTRPYYRARGFADGRLYMHAALPTRQ